MKLHDGMQKNLSSIKALRIIELMADLRRPVRLQDLAQRVSMPPSTVLRFLNSLTENGYVSQDPETARYMLTLKIASIGSKVKSSFPHRQILAQYLNRITDELQEASSLCVEQGMNVVYIETREGPDHMLQTLQRIGKVAPMHNTGTGKVLMWDFPRDKIRRYVEERKLVRYTPNTITSEEALIQELDEARRRGYAFDNEECEIGVTCIAGPVTDYSGCVVAAISVSMPTPRFLSKQEDAIRVLVRTCAEASRELA